jgi:hypothetical protein
MLNQLYFAFCVSIVLCGNSFAQCYMPQLLGPSQVCVGIQSNHYQYGLPPGANVTGFSVTGGNIVSSQTGNGSVSVDVLWNTTGLQTITTFFDCPGAPGLDIQQQVNIISITMFTSWLDTTIYGPDTLQAGEVGQFVYCHQVGWGPSTSFYPIGFVASGDGQMLAPGVALPPSTNCPDVGAERVRWCETGWQYFNIHFIVLPGGCRDTFHKSVYIEPNEWPSPTFTQNYVGCDSAEIHAPPNYLAYFWSDSTSDSTFYTNQSDSVWVRVADSNSCLYTDTFVVSLGQQVNVQIAQGDTIAICPGDSLQLTATSGLSGYAWSNGDSISSTVVTDSGRYIVQVQDTNGCSGADTAWVELRVPPNLQVTPGLSAQICPGDTLQFAANSGFVTYQWNPGGSTSSISVTDSGSYHLVATDSNGCQSEATLIVEKLPLPTVQLSPSVLQTPCPGDTLQFTATPGLSSYLWNTGDTTAVIQTTQSGPIIVSGTDASGCRNRDTTYVQPLPNPSLSLAPSASIEICPGDTVAINATPGHLSYLWSNGDTLASILVSDTGLYAVSVLDTNGCTADDTALVSYYAPIPLQINPAGPTTICSGDSALLSASPGFASYNWSPGGSNSSIFASQAGQYLLTAIDSNGCTSSDTAHLNVNPLPAVQINAPGGVAFCQGDSVYLSALPGPYDYHWSNGDTTLNTVVNTAGWIVVTVTDTNNCENRDSVFLQANSPPSLSISPSGPKAICPGDTLALTATSGHLSYLWSNGDTLASILVSDTGLYAVSVLDTNGCTADDTALVSFYASTPLQINPAGPTTICSGDSALLSASPGFASYNWSPGGSNSSIFASQAGQYLLTAIDSNGCTSSDTAHLNVNPLPAVQINAPGGVAFCQGDSVYLSALPGPYDYHWSNGDTTLNTVVNTAGWIVVTVTDANNCENRDSVFLQANSPPSLSISPSGPKAICPGDTLALTATSGHLSYLWSNGDTLASILVSDTGLYAVSVLDTNGCTAADTAFVNLHYVPPLQIWPIVTTNICEGDSVQIMATTGFASYHWSNGDSLPVTYAHDSAWYDLTAVTADGCSTTSNSVFITVYPSPTPVLSLQNDTLFCNPGYTNHLWYLNGSLATPVTNGYFRPSISGSYAVLVTDSNGCQGWSDTVQVNVVVGQDPAIEEDILVYPNPTETGSFWVEWTSGAKRMDLYDALGKLVLSREQLHALPSRKLELQVAGSGVYLLWMTLESGRQVAKKVVVK